MAESPDPNAAPMHYDVQPDFPAPIVALAGFLGSVAVIVGIILGVVLAND